MFEIKCVEKIKVSFFPENRAAYEIMWKIMVEPDRAKMAV
jgi:hypothetical protein